MRTKSRIEFIYLFIYLYKCINRGPHARAIGILVLVNSLKQKQIYELFLNWKLPLWLRNQTWNGITAFFFEKRYNIFGEEKT